MTSYLIQAKLNIMKLKPCLGAFYGIRHEMNSIARRGPDVAAKISEAQEC